jgi:hypothetical protein
MDADAAMLLILMLSPCLILCGHMCLARMLRTYPPQSVALYSVLIGYVPVGICLSAFVFSKMSWPAAVTPAVYSFFVYSGFAYFYFHLFNTSETARRIRLIYHIYRAGSLPAREIPALYNTQDIVELRLRRLRETGHLRVEDGFYSIGNPLLLYAALIVYAWRRVLGFSDN